MLKKIYTGVHRAGNLKVITIGIQLYHFKEIKPTHHIKYANRILFICNSDADFHYFEIISFGVGKVLERRTLFCFFSKKIQNERVINKIILLIV